MAKQRLTEGESLALRISVIIPAFNAEKYIAQAIASVENQTLSVHEIICVDDASTDSTAKIVTNSFPHVKMITITENSGPSKARNIGIKEAKGDIIAFLDSDDLWPRDKIEYLVGKLQDQQHINIVGGTVLKFSGDGKSDEEQTPYFNFYMSSFLIKKSVFQRIGYFDESMRLSEDQDWFFKVRESGMDIMVYNKVCLLVREHDHNTTKDLDTKQIGLIQALMKSIARRRKTGNNQKLKEINILDE